MQARARDVLDFVRQHGLTRARDVQAHFDHGRIQRWGGDLNVSSHLLEGLHHRGFLRVARREAGARIYQVIEHTARDASLGYLCLLLRHGVPHLAAEVRQLQQRVESRYAHAAVDGRTWFWPGAENPSAARHAIDDRLRILSPFDPVVWDRRRFRLFWGWEYKFEAYLPAHQRRMGHYAMPMLWGEEVLGWANLKVVDGRLRHELGFAGPRPRGRPFQRALDAALQRMQEFLEL